MQEFFLCDSLEGGGSSCGAPPLPRSGRRRRPPWRAESARSGRWICRHSPAAARITCAPASACSTVTCRPPPKTATSETPGSFSSASMLPRMSEVTRVKDLARGERFLQLGRRAQGDHFAAVHERDAMAVFRLVHIMRGDENGVAGRGELIDQIPELPPGDGIDAAGRLIQKQNGRFVQDRATKGEPLFPSAGEQPGQTSRRSSRPAIFST